MQVKFIIPQENDWRSLETELNEFLKTLNDEPVGIDINLDECNAIVRYNNVREGAICCECRFWDDGGSHDELIGLCQMNGGRKRFNCKACNKYEDVRG